MTDWHYRNARETAAALADGSLSSEVLVKTYLERIERLNPPLNAVVSVAAEDALAQAKAADAARERGESLGPLHGLPLTIKDVWEVAGMHCTAGAPSLRQHVPDRHADVIQRVVDAGAIVLGKTNVPLFASDTQTYNKIYGITNNPYDLKRTPGGSSGGAAAALAAGLTPLEIGSDVGGSIRTPAHFTGTFGHKPTRDIVSLRGHIPGPPGSLSQPDLAAGGTMARCADDLAFLLEIIAGPRAHEGPHWQLSLPPSRLSSLADARVATHFHDPHSPIEQVMTDQYQVLSAALESRGALVAEAPQPLLSHENVLPLYYNLLGSLLGTGFRPKQRKQMRRVERLMKVFGRWVKGTYGIEQYAVGVNQSFLGYVHHHEQREKMRVAVAELFRDFDVLLTPVAPTTAIPHDQSMPMFKRVITINGKAHPYTDQMNWIALATLLGLPATSAPVGTDDNGMPFNVQIIGGPGQDLTTIRFAQLLEEAGLSRFRPPEGF